MLNLWSFSSLFGKNLSLAHKKFNFILRRKLVMVKGTVQEIKKTRLSRHSVVVIILLICVAVLEVLKQISSIHYGVDLVDIVSLLFQFLGIPIVGFLGYVLVCKIGGIKP